MYVGVAMNFARHFGGREDLHAQNISVGGIALLHRRGRLIFYIITKHLSNDKTTMRQSKNPSCLCDMPVILTGKGNDRLVWNDVYLLLVDIF